MNTLDPKQESRVWSRVMGVQTQCCESGVQADGTAPEPQVLTAQMLRELLDDELRDCATYRFLAGKLCGSAQKILLKLSCEEHEHARKLTAIYFLMTGSKPCPEKPRPACVTCINESLRQRYQEELDAAGRYRSLAAAAADKACVFEQLAQEECGHAQQILQVLQCCLS